MVFLAYDDIPGVIGRVGTLFGGAGSTSRTWPSRAPAQGGKALMALSIDTAAPPELEEQLRAEGFDEVHVIALG